MRKLLALLFLLAVPYAAWAVFPVTSVLETCLGANAGPPPSGSFTNTNGTGLKILGAQCLPADASGFSGSAWTTPFAADQEVYVTISQLTLDTGGNVVFYLSCRGDAGDIQAGTRYLAGIKRNLGGDILVVYQIIGGSITELTSQTLGFSLIVSDQYGLSCIGTSIDVWVNGSSIYHVVDSGIAGSGQIAAAINANDSPQWGFINFGGGAIGGGGGGGGGGAIGHRRIQ